MDTSTGAPGTPPVLGVIGGSGVYEIDGLEEARGSPSPRRGAAHRTSCWPADLPARNACSCRATAVATASRRRS